jgi:hypothetical protein
MSFGQKHNFPALIPNAEDDVSMPRVVHDRPLFSFSAVRARLLGAAVDRNPRHELEACVIF